MWRAIRTALLTAIRNLSLYHYSSPPICNVASSWLGIVDKFDSEADIFDQKYGGPNSKKGSKALEREQVAWTSEPLENCITSGSPLCRGLIRANYILYIEHLRLMSQSGTKPGTSSLQRQLRLYIPFLGIVWPQPKFPHSSVFERFIYSQDQSTYFLQQNRQTHHGNI